MPRRTLQGLRIIVTGASGGIGQALADALLAQGARVLLFARRGERLRDWLSWQTEHAERAAIFAGDVTRADDRTVALSAIEERWQGLDGLINNAGGGALGRFIDADPPTLRRVMEVNFFAAVELTRAALPLLQAGHSPLVVNVGSILGHRATPQNAEYCASKFALRGWTQSVRAEFAALGIDLLLVSPGTTESEFYAHTIGDVKTPPWGNPKPIPAATVAARIIRAMERGTPEIVPSARGRALLWANRFFPGLVDRVMRKYG